MIRCPNCQAGLADNDSFCKYCGTNIQQSNIYAPVNSLANSSPNKKLVFNIIFAIILMCDGVAPLTSIFATPSLLDPDNFNWVGIVFQIAAIPYGALSFLSGVFLLMRKRIGYILGTITNIIACISSGLVALFGILICCASVNDVGEYAGLGTALGIVFIIAAIPTLILRIVALVYYRKNRSYFV